MRVVQINANADFGSTGLVVQGIHECLKNNGYESLIVYQRAKTPPENGYKVGSAIDWKCHALRTRLFGHYGFYSKRPTRRLLKYLDEVKPDIVHFHNLHSNFINIKLLCEYLADQDIPTIITLHDCWFFTGKCFHYIDQSCDKFIVGCNACPKRYAPPAYYLKDSSQKDWERKKELFENIKKLCVVGCSEWIANEASKSFLNTHPIMSISNGVDTTIFKPRKSNLRKVYSIDNETFVILGMANKWFLPRNKEVIDKIFNITKSVVIIIGCTPKQLERQKEMPSNVILKGFISNRSELSEYYSISNVFVNLTHADTSPTVNMESVCCGTPVVTYDVGGSPELIHKGTGIVVKEDDIDGILCAIKKIREDKFPHCTSIGIKHFDSQHSFSKYINLYNQIIK